MTPRKVAAIIASRIIRRAVERDEARATAALGFVSCPDGQHWMMGDPEPVPVEGRFRCPSCKAAV